MGDRLKGKVAIVTGSGGGIGRGHALALASEGAKIVVNDLGGAVDGTGSSDAAANKVVEEIKAAGGEAVPNYGSVATVEGGENIVKTAIDAFGRLDILVNNAGASAAAAFETVTDEEWQTDFNLKVMGAVRTCRLVIPHMRARGGGSIVNVASIAARVSMPGQAVYAMTKAGLVSLTKSFAKECGPLGVRVNAILPGLVESKFAAALVDDPRVQKWVSKLPIARTGQPADMVAGVLYLVSDGAAYTTGATLVMDGGATLG